MSRIGNMLRRMARHGVMSTARAALDQRLWRRKAAARARFLSELGQRATPIAAIDPAHVPQDKERFWKRMCGQTGQEFLTRLHADTTPQLYSREDRARRAARLLQECPDEARACLDIARRVAEGDLRDIVYNCPVMGATPNWLAHIDTPGAWPCVGLGEYLKLDSAADLPADPRLTWELNRLQHLPLLAAAWLMDGDPAHLETLRRHVESWIAQNPVGFGINWLQAQENALRALALAFAYALGGDAESFDDAFRLRWLALIQRLGATAAATLSDTPLTHNHLVTESAALWALGLIFPDLRGADGWKKTGQRLLLREVKKQIHPSGVHGEQALAYHFFVMESLAVVASVHRLLDRTVRPELRDALARMARAGERLLRSDGACWRVGDNDDGHVLRAPGAITQSRLGWLSLARSVCGETPGGVFAECVWFGPQRSQTSEIGEPQPVLVAFEDAGLVSVQARGMRLVFRAGPTRAWRAGVAPNHLHADFLSFVIEQDGRVLLDDPGVFRYNPDFGERVAPRRTQAHTAPYIDDGDCLEVTRQRFGVGERPTVELLRADWDGAHAHLAARHNGFSGSWLRRDILIDPGRFIWILDRYDARNSHDHTLQAAFQTACEAQVEGRQATLSLDGEPGARLHAVWPAESTMRLETDDKIWLAPRYGQKRAARRIVTTLRGKGALMQVLLLTLNPNLNGELAQVAPDGAAWRLSLDGVVAVLTGERVEWVSHVTEH